jgi:hypothetical protein
MGFLLGLERILERWANALWEMLIPRTREHVEVVGILRHECDNRALILDRQRTVVPNIFVIDLPPESHLRLTAGSAEVAGHLAAQVRRHAAEQGYTFAGPVAVHLARSDDADVGRFRIRSRIAPSTAETNQERTEQAWSLIRQPGRSRMKPSLRVMHTHRPLQLRSSYPRAVPSESLGLVRPIKFVARW